MITLLEQLHFPIQAFVRLYVQKFLKYMLRLATLNVHFSNLSHVCIDKWAFQD